MTRIKSFFISAALLVASLLISLAGAELLSRFWLPAQPIVRLSQQTLEAVSGPDGPNPDAVVEVKHLFYTVPGRGDRLRPNLYALVKGYGFDTEATGGMIIRTNDLGLRGGALNSKKHSTQRILFLGDSIVFADYLKEEYTLPNLLEAKLKSQHIHAEVLNAAVPASSSQDQYHRYDEIKDQVNAELVLVGMYLNDAQNSENFRYLALSYPWSASRLLYWIHRLLLRSTLMQWQLKTTVPESSSSAEAWWEVFRNGRDLSAEPYPPAYRAETRDIFDALIYRARNDFGLAWMPGSWEKIGVIMKALALQTEQRGVKLAVVLFPIRPQVESPIEDDRPQQLFRKMCDTHQIFCLDLLPAMREGFMKMRQSFQTDICHLDKPGTRFVADVIAQWLFDKRLLRAH